MFGATQDGAVHIPEPAPLLRLVTAIKSEATGFSPFYLNYGFESTISFNRYYRLTAINTQQRYKFYKAEDIAGRIEELLKQARDFLRIQQGAIYTAANRYRQPVEFLVGDAVWLNSKNLRTDRPTRKLDYKMLGPFIIIAKHGTSCELKLLLGMKAYPTFPVELLLKDANDLLPG